MVAVDMDSTFLRDDKSYDAVRFKKIFKKLKEKDIMFVVASGGQLQRLQGYFDEAEVEDIIFIAENGGLILEGTKELQATIMNAEKIFDALDKLVELPFLVVCVCGKKATYVLNDISDADFAQMNRFCPVLEKVASFREIEDDIVKLSLKNRELPVEEAMAKIVPILGEDFTPVPSGHISIDVITPGMHKGKGLDFICERYDINQVKTIAFGDNENDREMLEFVEHGYVMDNAKETLFDVSNLRAPDNNSQGVLTILEEWLEGK